jgi:PAS domain S-box-containing protein
LFSFEKSIINEAIYKKLFLDNDAIMLISDPQSGNLIDANKAAVKYFGYSRKKLTNLNLLDLYAFDSEENVYKHKYIAGAIPSYVVPCKIPGGKTKQVEIHVSKIHLADQVYLFSIIHDVTERIEAEKLLQYRQALDSLISSISTYFIRPDHHEITIAIKNTLQSIGKFINADHSFILKFAEDLSTFHMDFQWSDQDLSNIDIPLNTPTEKFNYMTGLLLKGEVFNIQKVRELPENAIQEKSFFKKSGIKSSIIIPTISAGIVIGGIGFVSIKTEKVWSEDTITLLRMVGEIIMNALIKKQAEDALRASEIKYRKFFEEDLTADYIADSDGRIKYCNPAFVRIFGFQSIKEAVNSNLYDLDSSTQPLNSVLHSLTNEQDVEKQEIELVRKDAEPAYVVGNFRGIFDDAGQLVQSTGYLFDITEHKRTEEQLRGAQKMDAIGRLAGGVAHDFNNLLTVINGYSDLLLNSQSLKPTDMKRIELIKKAGDRAASLTGQLLAFSRKQIVQPKILNLNAVISEFSKMLYRLIGENIEFVNELSSDLNQVEIDPTQLEQIIINLAVNARDAMPEGGKLTIKTYNIKLDQKFAKKHRPIHPGKYVVMEINDTGCGMDPMTLSHIFEPFFTTKEKGKGTGLGLSTIYGIVKQSRSYIWVESEQNMGTTFFIYFPTVEDKKGTRKTTPQKVDYSLHGSESIIIVEDDRSVRELTASFLKNFGYHVQDAEDAISARTLLKKNPNKFDLAIIDVVMPEMGGKQLSEIIRKQHLKLKVLFISGYTDNDIVKHGVLNNEVHFLQKPFTAVEIGKKVRDVLDSGKTGH